jgi:hypothetical protein
VKEEEEDEGEEEDDEEDEEEESVEEEGKEGEEENGLLSRGTGGIGKFCTDIVEEEDKSVAVNTLSVLDDMIFSLLNISIALLCSESESLGL